MAAPSPAATDSFFQAFVAEPDKKSEILIQASMDLSPAALAQLEARIEGKEKKDSKGKKKKSVKLTPDTTEVGEDSEKEEPPPKDIIISEKSLELFWTELEGLDIATLISEDVIKDFEYQGFNPDKLLKTIMSKGLGKGKNKSDIHKDIVDMVTIAVIKGSITDANLKKMSDQGKKSYQKYEDDYGLQRGGSKGKDPSHITVARVAAAMPGLVMKVLQKKPALSKQFAGPFGTTSLPYYLRHQSAAACIPSNLESRTKDFLLGLITAFTADQTKALSKNKSGAEELYDTQVNFVMTTHTSVHPGDAIRLEIFKKFSIENDYPKLAAVAAKVKKIKSDFVVVTAEHLSEDISKL
jgi:hypothetical protein